MLWPGIIAELGILGLSDALLYRAATRAADPRELFAATFFLAAVLSVVLLAIGLIVLPYALAEDSPDVQRVGALYLSAYLPIYFAALFLATICQGQLDMMTWNAVRVLVPIGYLAAIIGAVALGHATVGGFAAANIVAHVLSVAAGLVLLARVRWIGFRARWATIWGLL